MSPKYEIGQTVWRATWDAVDAFITCPDCGGTATIQCLLFDGSTVSIECGGCKCGYERATGRIRVCDRAALAVQTVIVGIGISAAKVEYRTAEGHIVDEGSLFLEEADALAKAAAKAKQADREERERIHIKEKPTRSWSWHVHYHRRAIREAERRIKYHTERLNVARVKAKEPVA